MADLLLLAKHYSLSGVSGPLVEELAVALAGRGHRVVVIVLDRTGALDPLPRMFRRDGVEVAVLRTRSLRTPRGVLDWFSARRSAVRRAEEMGPFDLVVNFSVAMLFLGVGASLRASQGSAYLVMIWDFVPWHQHALGPSPASRLLWSVVGRFEAREIRAADIVAVPAPDYRRFLARAYPDLGVPVVRLPIWGSGSAHVRGGERDPRAGVRIIFGGQFIPGRGLQGLVELIRAEHEALRRLDTQWTLMGAGPLFDPLRRACAADERVRDLISFRAAAPREAYIEELARHDVGLVSTDVSVEAPAFPSKSIDYLRCGLPILYLGKLDSSFASWVRDGARVGWVAVPERRAFVEAVEEIVRTKADGGLETTGRRAALAFERVHHVDRVAATIDRLLAEGRAGWPAAAAASWADAAGGSRGGA